MNQSLSQRRCVLVCQYRSCARVGAEEILAQFKALVPEGVFVTASHCLGLCGSGPNVQIAPDNVWYCHVDEAAVAAIVHQHLEGNEPVRPLMHPRMHAHPHSGH